jgi:translation initiation factor 2 beta subunit (eIF-2beta)/eIF-5
MTFKRPITEEDKLYLVDVVTFVKCKICRKPYTPTTSDISLNCFFYYKSCKACRDHRVKMKEKSLLKKECK